ncbi:hypothetical protein HYV12_00495 [Candidatus Dojkabacteria bacterium]|nr:hypothetical protein [Candidatus Dojkabacteria bacterium]
MLKSLLKFFFSHDSSDSSFYTVYQNIIKWRNSKVYPNDYDLPQSISLPYEFWERVKGLHKNTRADKLERSVSVYWVDGELIISTVTTGTTSFVKSNSQIRVSYNPKNSEYYNKEVIVDGKRYSRREVYFKKVPKQIELQYLFNMHTHPPHEYNEKTYYGFFSAQDIRSLIASGAIVTGLITDHLYLLFRTNKVDSNVNGLEDKDLKESTITQQYNYALYKGIHGKKLYRVSSDLS